jgi:hypothetical protein
MQTWQVVGCDGRRTGPASWPRPNASECAEAPFNSGYRQIVNDAVGTSASDDPH